MNKLKSYLNSFYKTYYRKVISITVSILIILSLYFRFIGPIPFSVSQTTTEKKTTFDVEASGKTLAVPDTAQINLGIQVNKTTVEEAQKKANEKINNTIQAIKKLGIEEKYIKTISYNVYPDYDYRSGQKIIGYNINITLQVKVKDFDKVNQVIDTATSLGLNQIGNLEFTLDDEKLEEAKMEARKEAIEKAKIKASQIAKAGGLRLGKIVDISENIIPNYPTPLLRSTGIGGEVEDQKTEIQPGESEITISVILSYETL